jgi:hypothetical protein
MKSERDSRDMRSLHSPFRPRSLARTGRGLSGRRRTRGDVNPNRKNSRRAGRLQTPARFGFLRRGCSNAAVSVPSPVLPPLSSAGVIPATKVRPPSRQHFSKSLDSLTAVCAAGAAAEEPKIAQAQALEPSPVRTGASTALRTRLAIGAMAIAKAMTNGRKDTRSSRLFGSEGHVLAAITASSRET